MPLVGTIALALALGTALLTLVTGMLAGRNHSKQLAEFSFYGVLLQAGLIGVASAVLLFSFISHDFSLPYVYGRSDVRMPVLYVIASFWGGQQGSLLFWVMITSFFGAGATWVNRGNMPRVMPYFHAVLSLTLVGYLSILNFVSSPFDTFLLVDTPIDGEGLNPLLQNPLMVIHPPCLLSGFATFAIPFAFGMAAMLARQTGAEWLKATRKWTLISWLFLSVGNILGGMWAYRELGWGGYWAWDPVENAALIPWFVATAFLHSAIIQEQRGMLKRWNALLVSLTYLLTLLGTWMTRSGLIESVHTFADSEIGHYFLATLVGMALFSGYVIASRWKDLKSEAYVESTVSREGAFLLNNWVLLAIAFVVLWGTLFPKIKEMMTGDEVAVGPTWFNRYTAPLGLALLALIVLGTLLPWRRTSWAAFKRQFTRPIGLTVLLTPVVVGLFWTLRVQPLGADAFGYVQAISILGVALVVLNLVTIVVEYVAGIRAKMRGGRDPLSATMLLLQKHRRRYGGYLVHVGVVLVFLAFTGNAFKADLDVTLRVGDDVDLGDFTVSFDGVETVNAPDKRETYATMTLSRGGRAIAELRPARFDFNNYSMLAGRPPSPMNVTSEIYIRSSPVEDVYVAFLNYDPELNAAAFKLVVLPFTFWFWFGGLVLVAGTMVCMWPEPDPLAPTTFRSRAARGAEIFGIVLALSIPAIVFLSEGVAYAQAGDGHDHAEAEEHAHVEPLTAEQEETVDEARAMIMTTCQGCQGKTLATASPSCAPSSMDTARIENLVRQGYDLERVLEVFVEERGESALAIPPDEGVNRLAWLVPLLLVGGGIGAVGMVARSWSRSAGDTLAASAPDTSLAREDAADDEVYLDRLADELAALE